MELKKNYNQENLIFLIKSVCVFALFLFSCKTIEKNKVDIKEESHIKKTQQKCNVMLINRNEGGYAMTLQKYKHYSDYFINNDLHKECYLYAIMLSKMDNEVFGNYRFYLDSLNHQAIERKDTLLLIKLYELSTSTGMFDVLEVQRRKKIEENIGLPIQTKDRYIFFLNQVRDKNISMQKSLRDSIFREIKYIHFDK